MKQIAITIVLLLASCTLGYSQSNTDTIRMQKVFGGYKFYQGNQRLSVKQMVKTMETNEEALSLMKSAQSNYITANIMGFAGGFMIGWPIGAALGGGDPNWLMAGIGAGIIAASIPFSIKFNKKTKKAIATYNTAPQRHTFLDNTSLHLSTTTHGLGLVLRF